MLGMSKGSTHLTLRQLEIFREAARLGNFRDASKALRISPTAIGQTVADLERSLGENVRLFDRSQTGSQLTDAGRVLLEHGDRMLLEEAAARRAISNLFNGPTDAYRPVRIAYEPLVAGLVGNGAYALIHNNDLPVRPFEVDAVEADHETVVRNVQSGEVDLGISYMAGEPNPAAGEYPVVVSPLVLIASNRGVYHARGFGKQYSLTANESQRFAIPSKRSTNPGMRELRALIDRYFLEQSFSPVVSFEGTTASSVLAMVNTGRMVTLNYTIVLHDDLHANKGVTLHTDLRAVPLVPPTNQEATLVVLLKKGARPSFGASSFANAFLLANKLEPLVALPEAPAPKPLPWPRRRAHHAEALRALGPPGGACHPTRRLPSASERRAR
jgi:DNA-binding transcriptional LysR family regulator